MPGSACKNKSHQPFWVVVQRKQNRSAFNGYRPTPSDYSEVICTAGENGTCAIWRTKAAYVDDLPDRTACPRTGRSGSVCEDQTHATCPDLAHEIGMGR